MLTLTIREEDIGHYHTGWRLRAGHASSNIPLATLMSSHAEPIAAALLGVAAAVLIYRARQNYFRPLELHLHKDDCVRRHTLSFKVWLRGLG